MKRGAVRHCWCRTVRRAHPAPTRSTTVQVTLKIEAMGITESFLITSGDTIRIAPVAVIEGGGGMRVATVPMEIQARCA